VEYQRLITHKCVGYVQKVLKPFFEKIEMIANSETLRIKVLEKLIISLKFSLEVFIKLI
jgi:hypothetical protein